MKKRYKILTGLAVVAVAAYIFTPSLGSVVKYAVNKYGSEVTGTSVNLQNFDLSLKTGEASISGLTVANPKGYKSENILSLGDVKVKVDLKSLMSDTIIIDEIIINKTEITYELLSLTQNNIKQLQANIAKNTASEAKASEKKEVKSEAPVAEKDAKPAKKVIIKLVRVEGTELSVQSSIPNAKSGIEVGLPLIEIKNIGDKNNGQTIAQSISTILTKIFNTASKAVVDNQLGDLKNIAKENLNNVVDGVKDRIKLNGIFGK